MRFTGKIMMRLYWIVVVGVLSTASEICIAQSTKQWISGEYSFSDELGGFRIHGVSGFGSRQDPLLVRLEFLTTAGVTMVIRSLTVTNIVDGLNRTSSTSLHLKLIATNNSNLPWIAFGLELQETFGKASNYGDGLSFDQLSRDATNIHSDRFLNYEDQFEPGDRLIYSNGVVDHRNSVTLNFMITDFSPTPEFFLYLDPMIPAS